MAEGAQQGWEGSPASGLAASVPQRTSKRPGVGGRVGEETKGEWEGEEEDGEVEEEEEWMVVAQVGGVPLASDLLTAGGPADWCVSCPCGATDDDGERMLSCDLYVA